MKPVISIPLALLSLTVLAFAATQQEDDDYDWEQFMLGFRFQNLGEKCSPSDPDGLDIYEQYIMLVGFERKAFNRSDPRDIQVKNFVKQYGRGRLCHPKLTCVSQGYCECRPGFTLVIAHFLSTCQVDTNYRCDPYDKYYGCGTNRTCASSYFVGRAPEEMPGKIGKAIQDAQTSWNDTTEEFMCVCINGRTCKRLTAGQILKEIAIPVQPAPCSTFHPLVVGVYGSILISVLPNTAF